MTEAVSAYAQGLYALAKEEDLTDRILEDLQVLNESFAQTPEFLRLLAAPNVSKAERCRILDDSFRGKVEPYVLNYMKILTEKGYIRHFSDCCRAYREQYNEEHGILEVRCTSALPLTADQQDRLQEKLAQVTGKRILLSCRTDPACLGGVRLDYDGKRVDGTVANHLASIGRLLKNTML